jgi:hypothetical protein
VKGDDPKDGMVWGMLNVTRALLRAGLAASQIEGFLHLKGPYERGALDKELESLEDQLKQALALVIQAKKYWTKLVKGKRP